ncbi:MAG: hypothetical protein GF350_12120, partial [Chitinivibrionales bacterium]|nr:hypothetical protein [Chitinivibrionales bacterium]
MSEDSSTARFSIILAIHQNADIASPFIHALSLASLYKGQFEIIDVRVSRTGDDLSVRKTLEKWGMLPEDSARSDVGKVGIAVKKIVQKGNSHKNVGKRIAKRPHDLLVMGTDGRRSFSGLFGQDITGQLAQSYRQTTLYIPRDAKPFVDKYTGSVTLNRVLVPVARNPDPEKAVFLLIKLLHACKSDSAAIT